jgi:protein-disulfide isomerase
MQISRLLVRLIMAVLTCTGGLYSQDGSTVLSRTDIEKIIKEYIVQHPEVLMDSVRAYRERERIETQRRSRDAVLTNRRELFEDAASPKAGKADAEVLIVQFFDYNCGYCKRVSPTLSKLLEEHRDVKVIFKELPILGAESHMASRAALAAEKQGAYLAFHRELMVSNGPITPATIEETGKKLGLDMERLRADMSSQEVAAILVRHQRLASAIGVQSTPSFVIGNELVSGAIDLSRFEELISKSRKP